MLGAFGHPVETYCDMLGIVGSSLRMVKFYQQHLWMLHQSMRTSSIVATRPNSVARHAQLVAHNNVAIC